MLKQTLVCTMLIVSIFSGSASAIAAGYDSGAEAMAWADRLSASAEFGTPDEARAMLIRAVTTMKADKSGAIGKFNHNDAQFRDRDLFVFCFNGHDGKFTAHEAFVGWDVRTLRDPNGKAFGAEMYADAQGDRITDVSFSSPLPGSTKLAPKRAYVMRIGDQVCGVSAYQFNGQSSSTH